MSPGTGNASWTVELSECERRSMPEVVVSLPIDRSTSSSDGSLTSIPTRTGCDHVTRREIVQGEVCWRQSGVNTVLEFFTGMEDDDDGRRETDGCVSTCILLSSKGPEDLVPFCRDSCKFSNNSIHHTDFSIVVSRLKSLKRCLDGIKKKK